MVLDDNLDFLRDELPEVFEDKSLPLRWAEDWSFITIKDPESEALVEGEMPVYDDEETPYGAEPTGIVCAGLPPRSEIVAPVCVPKLS